MSMRHAWRRAPQGNTRRLGGLRYGTSPTPPQRLATPRAIARRPQENRQLRVLRGGSVTRRTGRFWRRDELSAIGDPLLAAMELRLAPLLEIQRELSFVRPMATPRRAQASRRNVPGSGTESS